MVDSCQELKAPPRYADTAQLERVFSKAMPRMFGEVFSLIGRRKPRLTMKRAFSVRRRLHRFLAAVRPYLLGLGALAGEFEPKQSLYALLEGLVREHYGAAGFRVPENQDAFEFHITVLRKLAKPNKALIGAFHYRKVRGALGTFVADLHQRANPHLIDQAMEEWRQSRDARKLVQFIRQWPALTRQFRWGEPRRLTQKLATQLAQEYRECGAFLEQRLRLLAALSAVSDGKHRLWTEWEKQGLPDLLAVVRANKHLNPVASLIDRPVRNALAHGSPEVDVNSGECRFYDRQETITWKFTKFFDRARRLTYGVSALMEFELLMQLAGAEKQANALWRDLQAPLQPPSAAVSGNPTPSP